MALLIEITFYDDHTNEVTKKKLLYMPNHFDAYDSERALDKLKDEILKEKFPKLGIYDDE